MRSLLVRSCSMRLLPPTTSGARVPAVCVEGAMSGTDPAQGELGTAALLEAGDIPGKPCAILAATGDIATGGTRARLADQATRGDGDGEAVGFLYRSEAKGEALGVHPKDAAGFSPRALASACAFRRANVSAKGEFLQKSGAATASLVSSGCVPMPTPLRPRAAKGDRKRFVLERIGLRCSTLPAVACATTG